MVRFICSKENLVVDVEKGVKPKIDDLVQYGGKLYRVEKKGLSVEIISRGRVRVYKIIYISKESKKNVK